MSTKKPTYKSQFVINDIRELKGEGAWRRTHHKLDEKSAYALEMALATGRPLLVRGEPGIGKSQIARYAADVLDRLFVSEVININTEGQDLLWRYDPVARLNDAQMGHTEQVKANDESEEKPKKNQKDQESDSKSLDARYYLNPSVLWWVYDWKKAETQYNACRQKNYRPYCGDANKRKNGMVLLLDEIDKADPSLPNSLLEVFGNGGFYVPMLSEYVGENCNDDEKIPPLVIITTNNERDLPPAFVRRCLVLDLRLDDKEELFIWWQEQHQNNPEAYPKINSEDFDKSEALIRWLGKERAEVHYPRKFSDEIKRQVAQFLLEDRQAAEFKSIKPGQAEYLDLLAALDEMTDTTLNEAAREQEQQRLLNKIKSYALRKNDA